MHTAERRATAALWSIQGVGPKTLEAVRACAGPVGDLLEQPVSAWASKVEWRGDTGSHVMAVGRLARAADRVEKRCREQNVRILFAGDAAFPYRLAQIPEAPPLVFALGPAGDAAPRRRLAIVGTRKIGPDLQFRAAEIAAQAAGAGGLCIVSGAAKGTDQAAHRGALAAGGETWAFLGSGLDQIDFGQRPIARQILARGGSVFSEFPPGFRPNLNSFKLRNRLICGASDALLVFRAPLESGALHTSDYAREQKRPVLVTPGDPWAELAMGSNALLKKGEARPHLDLADLMEAVGLSGSISPSTSIPADLSGLSSLAAEVLGLLGQGAADFEALSAQLPAPTSGQLSAALVELEVFGAVVHKGGRRYEKR